NPARRGPGRSNAERNAEPGTANAGPGAEPPGPRPPPTGLLRRGPVRRGGARGWMDPFGIVWWILTSIEDVSPGELDRRFAAALTSRCQSTCMRRADTILTR